MEIKQRTKYNLQTYLKINKFKIHREKVQIQNSILSKKYLGYEQMNRVVVNHILTLICMFTVY